MKKKSIKLMMITTVALVVVGCSSGNEQASSGETMDSTIEENLNQDIDLQTVVDSIKGAYGETYYPNMPIEEIYEVTGQEGTLAELIENTYGISEELYEEIFIEVPMISAQSDMLIAVKVAEGKQEEIVAVLTAYREGLVSDALQYPMNQLKLQASQVIEKEGFAFFVTLGDIPMDVQDQGDDTVLEKAKEVNQIAVEAINAVLQ